MKHIARVLVAVLILTLSLSALTEYPAGAAAIPTNTPIHDDGRWVWPWEYQHFLPVILVDSGEHTVGALGYP